MHEKLYVFVLYVCIIDFIKLNQLIYFYMKFHSFRSTHISFCFYTRFDRIYTICQVIYADSY